ncbi:hypothetical protein ScPMuIL_013454 [Solemya velum]
MFWFIIIVGIVIFLWGSKSDPEPLCGIYSQPSKWYYPKYITFRLLLWLRKKQQKHASDDPGESAGYGVKSKASSVDMDRVQELPDDQPKAVDAVYFNGGNESGQYIVAATARRQNNVVQTILYLRLPGVGLLELPSLPGTTLMSCGTGFKAGGLELVPVTPMLLWRIKFSGLMRNADTDEEMHVEFDLEWKAVTEYFDFDTDLHPALLATAIAQEKWSTGFFDTLKRVHQTHYEQFGDIYGTVCLENSRHIQVLMRGVRDHSYGSIRDWKYFHRYGIQYLSLANGSCICVGTICMPMTVSRLKIGYIFNKDGTLEPICGSDFELYNIGEDGKPPSQFTIIFKTDKRKYTLHGSVLQAPVFYIGNNKDAKIHERFCTFTVNGIHGWGISEWDYRNIA